jgi:hypothetical protein
MTEEILDPDLARLTAPVRADEIERARRQAAEMRVESAARRVMRPDRAQRESVYLTTQAILLADKLLALPEGAENLEIRIELARTLLRLGKVEEARSVAPEIGKEIAAHALALSRPDTDACACPQREIAAYWTLTPEGGIAKVGVCPRCGFKNARKS